MTAPASVADARTNESFDALAHWPARTPLRELAPRSQGEVIANIATGNPFVIRQHASHWPILKVVRGGSDAVLSHLIEFASEQTARVFEGSAESNGRYFYNSALDGTNFCIRDVPIRAFLLALAAGWTEGHAYAGSLPIAQYFPGLSQQLDRHHLPDTASVLEMLWVGTPSRIAAHFDTLHNLVTAIFGKRRFLLLPPEQIANLYIGPLDFTLAGQPLSLVDFYAPDLARFPRFADAMAAAYEVILEPGDTLYIPPLWWHHVESSAPVGVMINHWWPGYQDYSDNPMNALKHAILSIAQLDGSEREAWRTMFDHYVFGRDEAGPVSHIPPESQGMAGAVDKAIARKVRAELLNALNR